MQFIKEETYETLSQKVAKEIATHVHEHPRTVLGLATGSTPLGVYRELIRYHREEGLDFSKVVTFNLDEYYGLSPDHSQSYHYYMHKHLFDHINVRKENRHLPDGKPDNIETYCRQYEAMIEEEGGIDIQILGIGANGHIGFNEPGDELQPSTHLVELAQSTIDANARFFTNKDDVPRFAVTMGIATILEAKRILLLATGDAKATIVSKLADSGITTNIPASLLHLHKHVQIYVDAEAARLL